MGVREISFGFSCYSAVATVLSCICCVSLSLAACLSDAKDLDATDDDDDVVLMSTRCLYVDSLSRLLFFSLHCFRWKRLLT